MSEGHVELPGSKRPRKQDAERVRDLDADARFEVTVMLRGQRLPPLDTSKPAMTRNELESGYGASPEDSAQVQATLGRFGLTVGAVSRVGRSMRVTGTAAQMQDAFQAGLGVYRNDDQGEFRGRENPLQIPTELDSIVTGVFGLDQRRVALRVSGAPVAVQAATGQATGLGPSDLEQHYNFPPGRAEGQKIAIAEFGGAYFPEDLNTFCAQHGLRAPQIATVDAGVTPLTPEAVKQLPRAQQQEVLEVSGEVMMDIEIVSGLCPAAEIFVYFSSFDEKGWIDLLNQVIGGQPARPSVLSVSWGLAEDSPEWSEAALEEINKLLEAAAHLGITVCAASGDDGSGDQIEDGGFHVNFPASSPFVLSVGGTMLQEDGEGEDDEVVWWQPPGRRNGGGGATGGGVSVHFDRPAWQQTVPVISLSQNSIQGRVVPDIAALAGPPGYDLVTDGKREPSGGTSAATPLWASLIARMLALGKPTQGQTFLAPLLYGDSTGGQAVGEAGCTDITKGNNASEPDPGKGYEAAKGFDAVSGWGVPDGQKLLASLP
jgi:kumamolisin